MYPSFNKGEKKPLCSLKSCPIREAAELLACAYRPDLPNASKGRAVHGAGHLSIATSSPEGGSLYTETPFSLSVIAPELHEI